MNENTTRYAIIEAADELFYQQGFEHTSFSDIADAVQISRGNFYYHFRTKDEILEAVIEHRLLNTQHMLEQWALEGRTPTDCIRSFINILIMNRSKIKAHGCPVGTLTSELSKLNHEARHDANKLFLMFRSWLRRQFSLLGFKSEADTLAMHVLAFSQGVATLANAFHDEKFMRAEIRRMEDWLDDTIASRAQKNSAKRLKS